MGAGPPFGRSRLEESELSGGIVEHVLTPALLAPPDPQLEEAVRSYFAPRIHIERYRPQPIY